MAYDTAMEPDNCEEGNSLWERLPAALAGDVLNRLQQADLVAVATACVQWRAAVQGSLTTLAPRSVLAMPFIAGCVSLKSLRLGQALPAVPGPFPGLSAVQAASRLTALSLASSTTAAWNGTAAPLPAADLACITALQLLQVLDLSQQPLLQQPGALQPLTALLQLSSLSLRLTGSAVHLPCSSWVSLASLTGLRELDVSGCALCYCHVGNKCCHVGGAGAGLCPDGSGDRCCNAGYGDKRDARHWQPLECQPQAADGAAAGQMQLVGAPLQLLSRLQPLQRLVLSDWQVLPTAAGETPHCGAEL
ncbi:hypothetical protein COO60DRAFT_900700 [Scenedesmus sp. NREL 46B-D3]|nr:hypothetical protein COO60DRAFT_900700 [Scenedesmus sp. NREL 46B-D3]